MRKDEMMKKSHVLVLDTPAIIKGYLQPTFNYTTQLVINEINRIADFDPSYLMALVEVLEFDKDSFNQVKKVAIDSGDFWVLSYTDLSVLALANQLKQQGFFTSVASDDYALLNVANFLGLNALMVTNKKPDFRLIKWRWYCPVCGYKKTLGLKVCPECGSPLKRSRR